MHGTWVTPHQNGRGNKTGQGNIEQQRIPMNGLNPAAESGLPGSELRTGTETLLELAGQNPEAAAQQAEEIVEYESRNFTQRELEELVDATIDAIRKIGLGPNEDLVRRIKLIASPFAKQVDRLSMGTSVKIREILSNNSGSTEDPNKPPLSPFGPNTPSKQNPQGSVSAA